MAEVSGPDLTGGTNGGALTDFVLRTGRMPVEAHVDQMKPRLPIYDEEQIAAIVSYVTREFQAPGPDIYELDPRRGNIAVGQQVYQEHCAACHATTGIGGAMIMGTGDDGSGKLRAIVIPGFERSDAQAIAGAVRTGPGTMPVFGSRAISDDELDSLVRYVLYLSDPVDEGGMPIGGSDPWSRGPSGGWWAWECWSS